MASMNQLDAIVSIASDLTAALSSEERYPFAAIHDIAGESREDRKVFRCHVSAAVKKCSGWRCKSAAPVGVIV